MDPQVAVAVQGQIQEVAIGGHRDTVGLARFGYPEALDAK